jgi:hypothetical protein
VAQEQVFFQLLDRGRTDRPAAAYSASSLATVRKIDHEALGMIPSHVAVLRFTSGERLTVLA